MKIGEKFHAFCHFLFVLKKGNATPSTFPSHGMSGLRVIGFVSKKKKKNYVNQRNSFLYIWFYRFNYNWNTHSLQLTMYNEYFPIHSSFLFFAVVVFAFVFLQMIVLIMNSCIKTCSIKRTLEKREPSETWRKGERTRARTGAMKRKQFHNDDKIRRNEMYSRD